jgi:hypothetical protein
VPFYHCMVGNSGSAVQLQSLAGQFQYAGWSGRSKRWILGHAQYSPEIQRPRMDKVFPNDGLIGLGCHRANQSDPFPLAHRWSVPGGLRSSGCVLLAWGVHQPGELLLSAADGSGPWVRNDYAN